MSPPPELCVGAVAVTDERLLLVRRGHGAGIGQWSVPGGRVEPGELLAAAVVREVAEETGLTAVCGPLLGWVERFGTDPAGNAYHYVILDFVVTVLDLDEPTAGSDATEAAWIPLHEVSDLDLVEGLAAFLAEHEIIRLID